MNIPQYIAGLGNIPGVSISSPSDGQGLLYDSSLSAWKNGTISGGGGGGITVGTGPPSGTPANGAQYWRLDKDLLYIGSAGVWVRLGGRSYAPGGIYAAGDPAAVQNTPPTLDRLTAHPCNLDERSSLTSLSVYALTPGEAGCKVRLGIYADTAGLPGSLILDAGLAAGDVVANTYSKVACSLTLPRGRYWFATVAQNAPTTRPTLASHSAGRGDLPQVAYNNAAVVSSDYGVTGALPATFTAIAVTGGFAPTVFFEVAT